MKNFLEQLWQQLKSKELWQRIWDLTRLKVDKNDTKGRFSDLTKKDILPYTIGTILYVSAIFIVKFLISLFLKIQSIILR